MIIDPYRFTQPSGLDGLVTGAYGIYALNKLVSAYAGACMRVRRPSDDATAEIGFVGNALDTAALASHCGGGSGFVERWYSQTGLDTYAGQATTTKQPKVYDTGAYLGEVLFDGTDDFLETQINSTAATESNSWYLRGRLDSTAAQDTYLSHGGINVRRAYFNPTNSRFLTHQAAQAGGFGISEWNSQVLADAKRISNIHKQRSNSAFWQDTTSTGHNQTYINGSLVSATTSSGQFPQDQYESYYEAGVYYFAANAGTSEFMNVAYNAIAIYETQDDAARVALIETGMNP